MIDNKVVPTKVKHIAIIMDGNGRWANERGLPRLSGPGQGAQAVREVISGCLHNNVQVLTLYALSTDNYLYRSQEEVSGLVELFVKSITDNIDELQQQNVSLKVIGNLSALPQDLVALIQSTEDKTKSNTKFKLMLAVNYSGQWDILQASKKYHQHCEQNNIADDSISLFSSFLTTGDNPPPDILIRTGGHHRLSNFLLWQCAYTEIYFCKEYWPDFNETMLNEILKTYAQTQRKFGRVLAEAEA